LQRNLPLNVNYTLIDKKYIPIEQSGGAYTCANCGAVISNIATVMSDTSIRHDIGFDCLETILINNSLLSTGDIAQYELIKKMIPKIIRFSKQLKETIELNNGRLTGFKFERPSGYFKNDSFITYWLMSAGKPYNTNVKIKDIDFDFLIDTLKNIFPKMCISID
jgi:hypothetical protein